MSMPTDLVFVRHGESEQNVATHAYYNGETNQIPKEISEGFDSKFRLSACGREQAIECGKWLRENSLAKFDRYYVSPYARTRETAGLLALNGKWLIDDRLREHDWGEFGSATEDERMQISPYSLRIQKGDFWYWRAPNGESKASDVRARFDSLLATLHRELSDKSVIAVTHGGVIGVARFVLERMTPNEWNAEMKRRVFPNCGILHYSRRNPKTGEISDTIKWRRMICPWDLSQSWDDSEWIEIDLDRAMSDAELLKSLED